MNKQPTNFKDQRKGFTLLEMIVSLALFAVVAIVAVGALVRIVGLNRQAQSLQSSMNNVGFALESMSRELRTGSNWNCQDVNYTYSNNVGTWNMPPGFSFIGMTARACPTDPATPNTVVRIISFYSSKACPTDPTKPLVYSYAFVPNLSVSGSPKYSLEKAIQTACGFSDPTSFSQSDFSGILDETNINLTSYELRTYAADDTANPIQYSLAFMRLTGSSGVKVKDQNLFDVQTSVSQRIHD